MHEAYQANQKPVSTTPVSTVVPDKATSKWPQRPWEPDVLWDYLNNNKVPSYTGTETEIGPEKLDYIHSLFEALDPDATHRGIVLVFLFGVEELTDLSVAQYLALDSWMSAGPPDYAPSSTAVEEAEKIIRHYQEQGDE